MQAAPITRDLVLLGGGHSHVQVLRAWAMRPLPGVRLTLVIDRPIAMYSGMVPGFVAGQYQAHELAIDCRALARKAGCRVIHARGVRIDPRLRRLHLEADPARPPIRFDILSCNTGSTVAGLHLPGVRAHAIPTRPIGRFVERIERRIERWLAQPGRPAASPRSGPTARENVDAVEPSSPARVPPVRVVVVGAGAGGVELAFTLQSRLTGAGIDVQIDLVGRSARPLPGGSAAAVRAVERALAERGISWRGGHSVEAIEPAPGSDEPDALHIQVRDQPQLDADAVVWVTGATGTDLYRSSELATDGRGFVLVRPTLQLRDHDHIFAAGDCAVLMGHELPRAGVYAVRQGPVLDDNLRAALTDQPLRPYRPQSDFLALLNLGDGRAIALRSGLAVRGRALFTLKDRIDRRFMERFQVVHPDGAPGEALADMEMDPMQCGGCAAKIGATPLGRALARLPAAAPDPSVRLGLDMPDDAAAFQLSDDQPTLLTTIDAFRAFTDDPFTVGRVAAANAVSDLYAKGVAPRYALALAGVPDGPDAVVEEELFQVLAGARSLLDELGITLLGGHSITAEQLTLGFSLIGPTAGPLLSNDRLEPGLALVLTRPLGTGVLFHADMSGQAPGPWVEPVLRRMGRANDQASRLALAHGARAATDVTGFGLAEHLAEMLRASGCAARISLDALPAWPGVERLLARGLRSTFHETNAHSARAIARTSTDQQHPRWPLLFDPQTSGGLLIALPPENAAALCRALEAAGETGARIGHTTELRADGALIALAPADPAASPATPARP